MQVAVERVPVGSLVIGVDLDPIRPIRGAIGIQEDITQSKCRASIKRLLSENGSRAFDLVLHDGSPNVGGAWAKEATSQNALVIDSVKLATEFLAPKGTFITKVFRSQDYTAVLYCLRQLFEKVEVDKPSASRSASAEIYVVAFKYKAPAKIDPRLLDFKHLFQGGKEPAKVVDVLRSTTKQKRHRDGYEDGATILRKVSSASDFVWSDAPLDILGSVTSISFDGPECSPIKEHALTTEEVKSLCDDLRVLGKQDFKYLLKWRMNIRKAFSPSKAAVAATTKADGETKTAEDEAEDDDEKVLNEMEEMTYAMDRKKKRAKKVLSKRRAKDKARKATGMQVDVMEDGYTDNDLFSLSSIKGKRDLVAVEDTENEEEINKVVDSDDEETAAGQDDSQSDLDSDEERKRYDEQLEDFLDQAYERFVARKEGSTKQRKRLRQNYAKDDESLEDGDDDMVHSDQDSDNDRPAQEANPLVVPLDGDEATQEEVAAKWFSQDVFADEDENEDMDKDDSEDESEVVRPVKKASSPEKVTKKPTQQIQASKPKDDFEIVPAPETDSSDDSSSDESEDDIETKAEILATAKKMLRKKTRETMLDDAYNKYMFHDVGLPKWFVDEEKKHSQPIKPVTKEEVAAMKAQFKEIDARPAKKVAQAKARKKRVAARTLEKVRKKANSISDLPDINERSKTKMIDQLYKKATPKRPKKELVVAKKGVQVKAGKGKLLVDRRMKKDTRAIKAASKKGKGNKGKNSKDHKGKKPGKDSAKGGMGGKNKRSR